MDSFKASSAEASLGESVPLTNASTSDRLVQAPPMRKKKEISFARHAFREVLPLTLVGTGAFAAAGIVATESLLGGGIAAGIGFLLVGGGLFYSNYQMGVW